MSLLSARLSFEETLQVAEVRIKTAGFLKLTHFYTPFKELPMMANSFQACDIIKCFNFRNLKIK